MYDPQDGRFIQVDPMSATGEARYLYVNNRPESFTDPLGLFFGLVWIPLLFVLAAIEFVAVVVVLIVNAKRKPTTPTPTPPPPPTPTQLTPPGSNNPWCLDPSGLDKPSYA
jgi:hypothetical protein